MAAQQWARGPIGPDTDYLYPTTARRTVLVVVHTVTAGTRLLDIVPLLGADRRVQVVFTRAPDVFGNGVDEFLAGIGGLIVPWEQAMLTRFDLAIAADHGHLQDLHAPLVVFAHGADRNKYSVQRPGMLRSKRVVFGLGPQWLVWDGAVLPAVVALSHDKQMELLAEGCPEALPSAVVIGDPCLDRMLVSQPYRDDYRKALGVDDGRRLVVVSSTWGPQGLLGRCSDLLPRLAAELPVDQFQVVCVLHPLIWYWHGPWQVRAWLAAGRRAGLRLVPPEEGWRAALIAADWVIGDHGSATLYGAAMGASVTLASFPDTDVHPASTGAYLHSVASRLRADRPLAEQCDMAVSAHPPGMANTIVERLTSVAGRSAPLIQATLYRLMELPQPDTPAVVEPVPLPRLI
ncbi:hypothetical protein [Kutzneria sp. CA-103260]|uniref:hypothetical protein n=1 Tax=Kutzneria sp. CA-103260 TaxID=2802641 RepID=UPI001BABF3C4|nr:hypothetical protein [Kutzneria sp. CA-103260]QUQ68281.1 hypothetical protein JJ691_60260 [Kutzneria sp. CA-103260]